MAAGPQDRAPHPGDGLARAHLSDPRPAPRRADRRLHLCRLGPLRARAGRRARADDRARGPLAARLRPRVGGEPGRVRAGAARPPPRRGRLREPRDRKLPGVRPPLVHGRRPARRAAARAGDRRRPRAARIRRGCKGCPRPDRPALGELLARRLERPGRRADLADRGLAGARDPLRAEPLRRHAADREGQLADRMGEAARRRARRRAERRRDRSAGEVHRGRRVRPQGDARGRAHRLGRATRPRAIPANCSTVPSARSPDWSARSASRST